MADNKIYASSKHDPGCRDLFDSHAKKLEKQRKEVMDNVKIHPNDGIMVSPDPVNYPASDHIIEITAHWKLGDQKRRFCLIIEDMEYGYEPYIKYCIPDVKKLLNTFRQLNLPIVWTNWGRRFDDGKYGGCDRFYGPQGVDLKVNPCYIYGENGIDTVAELAPQNEDEMSRSIVSLHLSKFADLDENGREILFPMLEAWGVDTIVVCGAWTDECLATTIYDAIDKYGYDTVVCPNGCATATIHGDPMMAIYGAATSQLHTTDELVEYLLNNPDKVLPPKARLHGDVRFEQMKYRSDPLVQENIELKKRIEELEKELEKKK